uniref:Uncharacterized protein n=1 Tax=Biomphalaria glabrata TaxID=6526 RepID=A0A2C9K8P0_BIOGL
MVMETVLVASTVVVEEKNINVWVEHARWWYQKSFNSWVLYVLALFQSLVVTMIRHSSMKRSPAVKTLVAMGFAVDGNQISADKKMWKSRRHQNQAVYITVPGGDSEKDVTRFQELLTTLKDQKNMLRLHICMDKEVVVIFLPCGHLISSCTDCAAAMKDYPVYRNHVEGKVRSFFGGKQLKSTKKCFGIFFFFIFQALINITSVVVVFFNSYLNPLFTKLQYVFCGYRIESQMFSHWASFIFQ